MTGVVWVIRRSRLRRRKLRAFDPCERCGFDLRATTGPCPECGRPRRKRREQHKPGAAGKDELFDDFVDEQFRPR